MVRDSQDDEATQELRAAQIQRADVPTSPPRTPKSPPRTPTSRVAPSSAGTGTIGNSGGSDRRNNGGPSALAVADSEEEEDDGEQDEGDGDEDDEEPLLRYNSLTKNQGPLYRNGDSVSAFLVAGDKLIAGTHNGSVNVFTLPSFQLIKSYRAHKASVTAISISPYPPPLPTSGKTRTGADPSEEPLPSVRKKPDGAKGNANAKSPVPNTPANNIFIGTSSIDGNVVIQHLVESRNVLLRNFGRPVQTLALSPDFRNDKTYLTGGMAEMLVKTVGGAFGKESRSTTIGGAAAVAQGWLGSVGMAADDGKDTVLHSGEGKINTIKWSLSGKYVVWVNEKGIKVMRSHLHLESSDSELAWKRLNHVPRPEKGGWEEMAGVWRARAEWIDNDGLETNEDPSVVPEDASLTGNGLSKHAEGQTPPNRPERLIIGWGSSIWIMDVLPGEQGEAKVSRNARLGRLEMVTILRTDCIVSGVSLYTPNLLLVLAYVVPEEDSDPDNTTRTPGSPSGGRKRRQNALPPEMRIIDIRTKEEVAVADTLNVSRFEGLSAADYHLATLPVIRSGTMTTSSRGALELMGELSSNLYGGIWDVAMYPKHLLGSGASVFSGDRDSSDKGSSKVSAAGLLKQTPRESSLNPALLTRGMKIFVHSPYDCVLATKPSIADHLLWLEEQSKFEEAWKFLDQHPEAAGSAGDLEHEQSSTPSTPTKGQTSLQDFFNDDASTTAGLGGNQFYSNASKEKRRIGDKWIEQLTQDGDWHKAGQVAGKVVDTANSWERWCWVFFRAEKYADVTPYIPKAPLRHQRAISSTVYEAVFGYYISRDPPRFAEVLDTWSTDLFDVGSVITAIESRLKHGDIRETSVEDGRKGKYWRILTDGLAKLYLADGRYRDALRVYIRLQDAEAALSLIKTQHLADAVADDVESVILLRVSREQLRTTSVQDLDDASRDIVQLLVMEAYQGIIPATNVINQLKSVKDMQPFLFFYLRALWSGFDPETEEPIVPESPTATSAMLTTTTSAPSPKAATPFAANRAAHQLDESRALVNDVADTALPLFAEYSRPIFSSFLRSSQSYTLSLASDLCSKYDYIPELVYLLAKEGRAKRALHVILDRLSDIAQAIAFAREQADAELWEDLIEYSLTKPSYVKVLLEEAGSSSGGHGALDPIALVKRIPDGLEIEGLKDALGRMLREFELRSSISEGVAKVCQGEVQESMQQLRRGQKRGIKFEIGETGLRPRSRGSARSASSSRVREAKPLPVQMAGKKKKRIPMGYVRMGHCAACGGELLESEVKTLVSFPCSHVFHLPCLILYEAMPPLEEEDEKHMEHASRPGTADDHVVGFLEETGGALDDDSDPEDELQLPEPESGMGCGVGAKVRHAKVLRGRIGGGCPLTLHVVA